MPYPRIYLGLGHATKTYEITSRSLSSVGYSTRHFLLSMIKSVFAAAAALTATAGSAIRWPLCKRRNQRWLGWR